MGINIYMIVPLSVRRGEKIRSESVPCAVETIVGEHEVIFAGTDEVISLKHEAFSKAVFAKGAVQAAKFLKGKGKGTVYYAGCNRLNSMIKKNI